MIFDIHLLNRLFFNEQELEYEDYKRRALQIIDISRPILEKHRGYKQILGNLMLLILSAGAVFIFHKACTGKFLFFSTDSQIQLNKLVEMIDNYSPK